LYYFKTGDSVLAKWKNGLQYPATTVSQNENGTWNIKWKDCDPDFRYYHTNKSLQHDFKFTHQSGELVLAKFEESSTENYWLATLIEQNAEGNWEIAWADGDPRQRFNRHHAELLPTKQSPMVILKFNKHNFHFLELEFLWIFIFVFVFVKKIFEIMDSKLPYNFHK